MAISKIILNGVTQIDLTSDTVAANNLIAPNTAHGADGEAVVGTATHGITPTGTLNITENDTYDVTNYASAVVNVPSSGSSGWTKVAETTYQVTAANTSAANVATWATGHSELWGTDKMVYVRIRDTEGRKSGHFFGTDNLFWNSNAISKGASSSTVSGRVCIRQTSDGANLWNLNFQASSSTTGYGVYADTLYSDGRIRIQKRYNSSYSLTVDGTYKIEVYMIDYPIPFYE